ncbi:27009_t:CDS:1, partial [Racocetra persica]
ESLTDSRNSCRKSKVPKVKSLTEIRNSYRKTYRNSKVLPKVECLTQSLTEIQNHVFTG